MTKKASERDRGNVRKGGKKIKCWRKREKKKQRYAIIVAKSDNAKSYKISHQVI